jgi:Mg-chelatase subunit ChlD
VKQCVSGLTTGGSTALGPALAMCVGMASNFPSAEIIVCTDGVSNVGCGNISKGDTGFYTSVSVVHHPTHTQGLTMCV